MRALRSTVAALAVGVFIGTVGMQVSAMIPTSPAVEPTAPGIIGRVNDYLGSLVSKYTTYGATSELQFSGAQSWAVNSNVATTMTSLGPQGSHTTVQKWLAIVDNTGTVVYLPAY